MRGFAPSDAGHGRSGGSTQKLTMNGVDVTDVSRNFTSDEWEKLKIVGGHTYVYQRRVVAVVAMVAADEAAAADAKDRQVVTRLLDKAIQRMIGALRLRRVKTKSLSTQPRLPLLQAPRYRQHLIVAHRMAHALVHDVKVDSYPQRPRTIPRRWGDVIVQPQQVFHL